MTSVELTAQEKKVLDALRHEVHMIGPLAHLKDMVTRVETGYGEQRVAFVEKQKLKGREFEVVSHTIGEFKEKRAALGTALTAMGLKGKHIAIIGETSFNWILSFYATVCGVGVAVPLDKEMTDEEISHLIEKADCDAVFCSKTYFKAAKAHMDAHPDCVCCVTFNKEVSEDRYFTIDALIEKGKSLIAEGNRDYIDSEVNPEDLCAIIFTSGTTGANKGVMLSHRNFCANVDNVIETIPTEYSSFSLLPINHVFELSCNIMVAFYMNAVIYINDSLKNILPNIQLFQPDAMNAVPLVLEGIYNGIWAKAKEGGKDEILKKLVKVSNKMRKYGIDLRHVLFKTISKSFGNRFPTLICGGAPSRKDYVTGLGDMGFRVYNGYGLTETAPSVTLNMQADKDPTSAGFALPRCEFRINEPDADGVGEIWVKGTNVFSGYYKDEEATAASFEGEWFKTGDYGTATAEGELFVVGRKKTLIILDNGKNVFPEDIEFAVMDNLPYIREACALEAEKEIAGELRKIIAVVIYVEPADFEGMTEEEIKKKVADDVYNDVNRKMISYKKVQDVLVVFNEFEKTTTRKVIRQKVTDAYNAAVKTAAMV